LNHFARTFFLILFLIFHVDAFSADAFPSRTIRILVPGSGGGGDFAARLIAQGLAATFGQQLVVDNRPVGVIPADIVAKSPPDGYTWLLSASTMWLSPQLQPGVPYDPQRDFSPITLAVMSPNLLAVHPSLPVKTVKELIVLARTKPGALNYGSGAAGSSNHLSGELFKSMAGVNIVRVNYKNPSQAVTDLISGRVHVMFYNAATVAPFVKSGKLRGLAVTSAQPSALAPQLPTIAAAGLPGYESVATFGVFGPAKLPSNLIQQIHSEITRFINKAEIKQKFFNAGSEVVASTPEDLATTVRTDIAKLAKLITDASIKAD
jgi:tripartite-type tricarboxylate transporter receptor subunit TctC